MKLIRVLMFLLLSVQQAASQNLFNTNVRGKPKEQQYTNKEKSFYNHPSSNKAVAQSIPYCSLNFTAGQAPFKHSDFSPKVQFDYSLRNRPLTYNYLDSLHWPAHNNPSFYGGFGLEFGMTRGFYGEFDISIVTFHKYTSIIMLNLAAGYNQVISENLYLRASLAVSYVETDLDFSRKREFGGNLIAFGNVYKSLRVKNPKDRGTVAIRNSSLGFIPKVEVNYDLLLSAKASVFASFRFGVGYHYPVLTNSSLFLQAAPRVDLNTSGLQFSDGGISPNRIFNYKGLIWNFTIAIKVLLQKKGFKRI